MANAIVYEGVTRSGDADEQEVEEGRGDEAASTQRLLFTGFKLWFSRAVPSRDWLIQNAESNGATIVPLEKQADVRLVDHARKNQAPDTHSYRWVEWSIRKGELEPLETHLVGSPSRSERPVGSVVIAPKKGRTPFTEEEDQFLWDTMIPFVESGGLWKGNEIYKQIEQMRPNHTFQSWRDRWIKKTQYQNREITQGIDLEPQRSTTLEQTAAASEPAHTSTQRVEVIIPRPMPRAQASPARLPGKRPRHEESEAGPSTQSNHSPKRARVVQPASLTSETDSTTSDTPSFTKQSGRSDLRLPGNVTDDDMKRLYRATQQILDAKLEAHDEAWAGVAEEFGRYSALEWKNFWLHVILPEFCRRQGKTFQELAPNFVHVEGTPLLSRTAVHSVHQAELSTAPQTSSPRKKSCSNCFTTETRKWRKDKAGNSLCNECGYFLKTTGRLRPSTAWADIVEDLGEAVIEENRAQPTLAPTVLATDIGANLSRSIPFAVSTPGRVDAGVQTSPIIPPQDSERHPAKSPTFEPPSPIPSRRVESNVARKRSTGRSSQSNSQESRISHQSAISESAENAMPRMTEPVQPTKEPVKTKRPRLRDDPLALEIPSTPEHEETHTVRSSAMAHEEHSTVPPLTETPVKRRQREGTPARIPHFMISADTGEPSTPGRDTASVTGPFSSPLRVDLVSEPGEPEDDSNMSDTRSTVSDYAFETAPDVSENWETAPETPRTGQDSDETQGLVDQSVDIGDDPFALPDPEGGWEFLDAPSSIVENGLDTGEISRDQDEETSSQVQDVDYWIASRSTLYPNVPDLESILLMAVEATSFDYDIADQVVGEMVVNTQQKNKGKGDVRVVLKLPEDIPGCWTSEDDSVLRSDDARGIRGVELKHGQESCNRRFKFLEAWG